MKSQLGKGTTFCLLLPSHAELGGEDDLVQEQQVDSGEYPSARRVLVVDDEPTIAEYIQRLLESRGYRVTAVTSSPDALETFRNAPKDFDLVITDQTMPSMTGVELSEEILKIQPRVPIFLMTGYPDARVLDSAKAVGIRECLSKPLDAKSFRHLVRRYTSGASLGDSSCARTAKSRYRTPRYRFI